MSLNFDNISVKLTNVNHRPENHGPDEFVSGFDFTFEANVDAICYQGLMLDQDKFLSSMWTDNQPTFPEFKDFKLVDVEFENGTLIVRNKFGQEIEFLDCKVKSLKVTPKTFRIATLKFTVQYSSDDESEAVPMFKLAKHEGVQITLTADRVDNMQQPKAKKDDAEGRQKDAFNGVDEEPEPLEGADLEDDFGDELPEALRDDESDAEVEQ